MRSDGFWYPAKRHIWGNMATSKNCVAAAEMENPISRQHCGWTSIPQTTTEISVVNTPHVCITLHMNTTGSSGWNSYLHTIPCLGCVHQKAAAPTQCRILCWAWICSPDGSYCSSCCEGSRKHCLGISEKAHDKKSLLLYRNVPATQPMSSVLHLFVYRKTMHGSKFHIRTKCCH